MVRALLLLLLTTGLAGLPALAAAEEEAPFGRAEAEEIDYSGQKVVFDVAVDSVDRMNAVLDRAGFLSRINGEDPFETSVVIVLHGSEIPFFAVENFEKHEELVRRAQDLTLNGVIEFRMCREAASFHDYEPDDIHGFVTMVPMAEAEIVRLQQEEDHAYLQYR
ncbi:MAG: hypothetical protein ACOCUJ_03635 [Thiohalospira sp.]|uniref:DsrE family protein n=1 Tax=Thiohalospira sp. TaxID=3080549 RepID=UPI00397FBEAD